MKTAVIYYSLEGNTKFAAEKVAKATGADIIPLVPVKAYPDKGFKKFLWGGKSATMKEKPELQPYSFDAAEYDKIVLCSPVWAGTFAPPLRTFLNDNNLAGKIISVIACSSGGNTEKCIEGLKSAAKAGSLAASLSLTDPKSRPSEENEKLIEEFIAKI
ncbi:MAG: NAD(P)H-dependent oxidoreductase [Clostridia bacterium]|nr:NAD(P)H-dependent oxidoreductase [Clostridia bacterium]